MQAYRRGGHAGTLARHARDYRLTACGAALAFGLATMLALSLWPPLQRVAASAGEGGAHASSPAHDRTLSKASLERAGPPRDDEDH